MSEGRELVYGTCVAFGARAVLLRGESGAGKSDLALRFIALGGDGHDLPALIADDQVWVQKNGSGNLVAFAPETLAGKIEVRGVGIMNVAHRSEARLMLVCDLADRDGVPRLPPEPLACTEMAGVSLPCLTLMPFEASAPLKLKLALLSAAKNAPI
ncbi:MAG: HPr kinase/phosphorylase [Methyloceanibacter sp.]|uniref:HPr kinase/phosphorylase n=1 Tax=Methyloceanibacter sp. TaxID=1965321 RepID=UPI003D9B05B7